MVWTLLGTVAAVGYDGRLSSPALETELVNGLKASGMEVVRIGLGPTPMLYFATRDREAAAGILQRARDLGQRLSDAAQHSGALALHSHDGGASVQTLTDQIDPAAQGKLSGSLNAQNAVFDPAGSRVDGGDGGTPVHQFAQPVEHVVDAFLKVGRVKGGKDCVLTVAVPFCEMGQGITTILPQIIAYELGADWRQIAVEPAPLSAHYANLPLAARWSALWFPAFPALGSTPGAPMTGRWAKAERRFLPTLPPARAKELMERWEHAVRQTTL